MPMEPKLAHDLEKRIVGMRDRREALLDRVKILDDKREIEDVLRLSAILSCKQQSCRQRINRYRFGNRHEFSGIEPVTITLVRIK